MGERLKLRDFLVHKRIRLKKRVVDVGERNRDFSPLLSMLKWGHPMMIGSRRRRKFSLDLMEGVVRQSVGCLMDAQ